MCQKPPCCNLTSQEIQTKPYQDPTVCTPARTMQFHHPPMVLGAGHNNSSGQNQQASQWKRHTNRLASSPAIANKHTNQPSKEHMQAVSHKTSFATRKKRGEASNTADT